MVTKEEFFKTLAKVSLPNRLTSKVLSETFDLDEYRNQKVVYHTEEVYLEGIIPSDKEVFTPEDLRKSFEEFMLTFFSEKSVITYESGYYENDGYFKVRTKQGMKDESDKDVIERLKTWIAEYKKQERDYQLYLDLKEQFEKPEHKSIKENL